MQKSLQVPDEVPMALAAPHEWTVTPPKVLLIFDPSVRGFSRRKAYYFATKTPCSSLLLRFIASYVKQSSRLRSTRLRWWRSALQCRLRRTYHRLGGLPAYPEVRMEQAQHSKVMRLSCEGHQARSGDPIWCLFSCISSRRRVKPSIRTFNASSVFLHY